MRSCICAARVQEEETDMQNFTKQGGRISIWPPLGSAPEGVGYEICRFAPFSSIPSSFKGEILEFYDKFVRLTEF